MTWPAAQFPGNGNDLADTETFPDKKPTWTFTDALALIGVYILTNTFLLFLASLFVGSGSLLLYAVPLTGAPIFTLTLAYIGIRVRTPSDESVASLMGFRIPEFRRTVIAVPLVLAGGIGLLMAVNVIQNLIVSSLGISPEDIPSQHAIELLRQDPGLEMTIALTFFAVVVAPFTEEVLFRSTLYLPLRSRTTPIIACFVVSFLFAVVHWYAWGNFHLFVISLILVALLETTRSLLVPIAVHAMYNGLVIAALFAGWT